MAMRSAGEQIGRPYVAPPGTPRTSMKILREAFGKNNQRSGTEEDAKKSMMELQYIPADECLRVINFSSHQPEDIVKEFSRYMEVLDPSIFLKRTQRLKRLDHEPTD